MAKVDMTGVSVGYELIPDGVYSARVIEAKDVPSKDGQATNAMITFEVVDSEEYEGRKLSKWYSLKPTAAWSLKTALVYMGVDKNALEGEIDTEDFYPIILGEGCTVSIGHHEQGTKTFNDIEVLDPATDLSVVGSTAW